MKFHKHLYIGESIKNPNAVKWKLRINADLLGIFVITLSGGSDQLEIYDAVFLKQKLHRKLWPPYVVGMASGQAEAMEIVRHIVDLCYKETGTANIKDYLNGS